MFRSSVTDSNELVGDRRTVSVSARYRGDGAATRVVGSMRTQSPNGDGKGIVRIVQILWKDSPLTSCRSSRTSRHYLGVVGEDDTWAGLADQFADEAYASVKGRVRTYVLHQQLLEHLPAPPAPVLDVGGGAGHQSFLLAQAGYDVTLLDPSSAMLDKARQRLQRLPGESSDG